MDLVLGPGPMPIWRRCRAELALYDRLLAENDQDLMAWMLGQVGAAG
jgi:succinate dehydrogenase flavin-adding protein (antitoxin of CptAB toxin-antitoxin module)